jgi:hypothetical protein
MNITATVAEKMVQIQGVTRLVQASNEEEGLRIYLAFAQPVLNSSEQILRALTATDAVAVHLTPTNRSTLGNRRFGYVVTPLSLSMFFESLTDRDCYDSLFCFSDIYNY